MIHGYRVIVTLSKDEGVAKFKIIGVAVFHEDNKCSELRIII